MLSQEIIAKAHKLADLSEEIAKKYFRLPNGEEQKDDQSPVTKADREIEEALCLEITRDFGDHGIVGEEFGVENADSDYVWVLDPIDGTSSFIIGRPTFGTLIALYHKKKPVLGIVNQPITAERWLGIDDGTSNSGAWFNGSEIRARNCKNVEDAVISTTSPYFFDDNDAQKFQNLCQKAKYQKYGGVIYGGDCYSYALLASGFVDIIVEPNLQIYDYGALVPIVKMAGGVIGDWRGIDLAMNSGVKLLACASQELYDKAQKIMQE